MADFFAFPAHGHEGILLHHAERQGDMSLRTPRTPLPAPLHGGEEIGPLVGRRVGRYRVTGYLGEGPTGVVYRCDDPAGRPLALKALHRDLGNPRAAAA